MAMIFGAGMAGLLAGCALRGGTIYETQNEIPNNHHSLLRFRSSVVGDYLGIPFREVKVMKISMPWRNPVADALSYSEKANGVYGFRSSISADGSISRRFIAPEDFIQRMAETFSGHMKLGCSPNSLKKQAMANREAPRSSVPIISTIPMPNLMDVLGYEGPKEFKWRKAWVIEVNLHIESTACATIYYPDQDTIVTRATLTETKLQIELCRPPQFEFSIVKNVIEDFGIRPDVAYSYEVKEQAYGKIEAIDDRDRRKFIMWATDNFNIYSLGRFATWKPGLLLDDVLGDLFKVREMIRIGDNYSGRLPKPKQGEKP